ncbi:hypothetical protein LZ683_08550 [Comamonas testosteroni]|uniref:hypothetical protein n=1 Tax=Comamonas testosteroni TaxID=285 RepID=UPI0023AA58AF|nr:hypothetical protein [Comamonas testosteroni]WEE79390.1 hypothetical protein LZ683_08550 [Comamonas testosteroni]
MASQHELPFYGQDDLAKFDVPHYGRDITYGNVSRHLRHLWRYGDKAKAAELAKVAGSIFNSPGWAKQYPDPNTTGNAQPQP